MYQYNRMKTVETEFWEGGKEKKNTVVKKTEK